EGNKGGTIPSAFGLKNQGGNSPSNTQIINYFRFNIWAGKVVHSPVAMPHMTKAALIQLWHRGKNTTEDNTRASESN
ncbi:hypothetical protein ACQP3J_31365, partial [Escherichia coli]